MILLTIHVSNILTMPKHDFLSDLFFEYLSGSFKADNLTQPNLTWLSPSLTQNISQ